MSARNRRKYVGPKKNFFGGAAPARPPAPPSYPPARPAQALRHYYSCKEYNTYPTGLLHPLPIPEWKWETISMDFITGLPTSTKQNDAIMVLVDKLSKSSHFIPVKSTYKAIDIARVFMK
jgi:hypothetical protein